MLLWLLWLLMLPLVLPWLLLPRPRLLWRGLMVLLLLQLVLLLLAAVAVAGHRTPARGRRLVLLLEAIQGHQQALIKVAQVVIRRSHFVLL